MDEMPLKKSTKPINIYDYDQTFINEAHFGIK